MKNLIYILLLTILFKPTISAAQNDRYQLVSLKPAAVFTPKGFDSNDNAQVILYGVFHDVCHKIAPVEISIDKRKHQILINNRAYMRDICIEIYVNIPYTITVNLGTLPKGDYNIMVSDGTDKYTLASELPIAPAKNPSVIDDQFYAYITDAQVITTTSNEVQLTLKAVLNNTCLSLREVKTTLTLGNVYDILPIMDVRQGNCQSIDTPFEKTIILKNLPQSPTLLNIRSSGGQSIEKVIDTSKNW